MNVLIVDDDMATVDVICKSVNWSALHIDKVMTAYNIEKAKEILADTPADIVVCDIEMPMGNGTELLKWVGKTISCRAGRSRAFAPGPEDHGEAENRRRKSLWKMDEKQSGAADE